MNLTNLISIVRAIHDNPIELILDIGDHTKQFEFESSNGLNIYVDVKTTCYPKHGIKYASDGMSIDEYPKEDITIEATVTVLDQDDNEINFNYKTSAYLNGLAEKLINI
jgi:hypothetical protein